jgi:hypothetical protein
MPLGRIHAHLSDDHRRLERLLEEATRNPAETDMAPYALFRAGLLRHIGMEEKILIPAAKAVADEIAPLAAKIRADHGAITALLVPPPSPTIVRALRSILDAHDVLEEKPDGLYAICECLIADNAADVLARLEAAPAVPVSAHNAGPTVLPAVRRALERAGYDLEET